MAMSRKDFEAIAAAVDSVLSQPSFSPANYLSLKASLVDGLANALSESNPRFDRGRFIRACFRSHSESQIEDRVH